MMEYATHGVGVGVSHTADDRPIAPTNAGRRPRLTAGQSTDGTRTNTVRAWRCLYGRGPFEPSAATVPDLLPAAALLDRHQRLDRFLLAGKDADRVGREQRAGVTGDRGVPSQ